MSKVFLPTVFLSVGALFATSYFAGCGGDSPAGGGSGGKSMTGGAGTGGAGTGGAGTGGAATGGAATGGAATGGAATGGAATGGAATGGAASGGAAGGSAGGAAGGRGGGDATGGAAGGRGGGSAGGAGGGGGAAAGALATIAALTPGTITGTAEFVAVANGVQVTINLSNCPPGVHGIHIHQGTGCAMADQGTHWGGSGTATNPSRGEGIGAGTGEITCDAQMKGGPLVYTRTNASADTTWTIGGSATTNIIGHPIIVHSSTNATDRHGCGLIQAR
ncbi:MAG: superoxide dismutase family protein [Pseudomonadota bacterium]